MKPRSRHFLCLFDKDIWVSVLVPLLVLLGLSLSTYALPSLIDTPATLSATPSPLGKDGAEVGNSLFQLPSDILLHVLHPSSGMSSEGAAAFLSTSKHSNALKSSMSLELLFYYSVASPFLGVHFTDNAMRVSQALRRCGALPLPAKKVLYKFYARASNLETDVDFIMACLSGMTSMIQAGIIPSIRFWPERFKIQFVYKIIHIPGAFEEVMQFFNFSSITVQRTLHYEMHCGDVLDALDSPHYASTIAKYFQHEPIVTAGCIAKVRRKWLVELFLYNASLAERIRRALFMLEAEYSSQITAYRLLLEDFCTPEIQFNQIDEYVKRGLLINSVPTLHHVGAGAVAAMIKLARNQPVAFEALLSGGMDIHIENVDNSSFFSFATTLLSPKYSQSDWNPKGLFETFLENGFNVNRVDGYENSILLKLMTLDPHLLNSNTTEILYYLVDSGASVDAANLGGMSPLLSLSRRSTLPVLRYFVEHGHPKLNKRDALGETLLFGMIKRFAYLEVLQYLHSQGADVRVINHKGESLLTLAQRFWLTGITDWLISLN